MGPKNVPKKFGTPGPNLAPDLFGLFVQGQITKAGTPNSTVCNELKPKRLGAKFGPGVPNFLGTFFGPICRVWTHGLKFFGNSPALVIIFFCYHILAATVAMSYLQICQIQSYGPWSMG